MKGGPYMFAAPVQFLANIPKRLQFYLQVGHIQEKKGQRPALPPDGGSPYTDLTQDLGDRLTEYELIEDLIERGTLGENADGTLFIRLQ